MNHFTIKDIENLCGIKAHTLRIWEQRYSFFTAKRKKSRHRIYDCEDLKELLRISFLYHNGHRVSQIAELSPEQIHVLVEQTSYSECNHQVFIHQLLEAGVDFDKEKFEKVVNCLVLRIGLEKCITEVFYPFLQRLGLLWMTNHVIPAQEHFVSHIIRKKIIMAIDGLEEPPANAPVTCLFAPAREYHEIPLLCAHYFFRKYGNRTVYFGVNVQEESLGYYLQHHPVHNLYTHVITQLGHLQLEQYIKPLYRKFPGKKLFVSGPAVPEGIEQRFPNCRVLRGFEEMITLAKKLPSAI